MRDSNHMNHCVPTNYGLYYNYVNLFHLDKIKITPLIWLEEQ